ncbi:hypothetical protein HJC23_009343 [Cyclotella cryptica]|uniref:N-acetyltransferase domain-containing protein n=1 Tax=Cyclotella cryptica TaxID=29204 RepID=A0ABD3QSM1_9STRA|eukprot:CCRYP_002338-RA/>CCRYP_002338-RA protein AED:0.00 eAED:0.00 QI:123/1/1/1/0/0/2/1107/699
MEKDRNIMTIAQKNPTSISKTALDSLDAKLSAIDAGWLGENLLGASDGGSMSADPVHVYTQLLQRLRDGLDPVHPKRRMSPLVNAGYAARMAVTTCILKRWINGVVEAWAEDTFNSNAERGSNRELDDILCVNVVVIGCGMDALGIWSKHLLRRSLQNVLSARGVNGHETFSPPEIKVYEFDAYDNCVLKQNSLLRSGLLNLSSCVDKEKRKPDEELGTNKSYHIHARGRLNLEGSDSTKEESDYTLVSTDLRKVDGPLGETKQHKSILSHAGLEAGFDPSQPTIILSELVLAYLGCQGANAVIHSISNDVISGNKLSTFVCLEPMFPNGDEHDNTSRCIFSVQESYAINYCRQFRGKLQTGNSTSTTKANVDSHDSLWLHPLGSHRHTLKLRLESCGISCFSIASLGESAIHVARSLRRKHMASFPNAEVKTIGPKFLCAKEPFDEHAALSLNLECYCVVCAFHPSSATRQQNYSKNYELHQWMNKICPWPIQVQIKPISTYAEDTQVNDLYKSLYVHFYNKYPAIRKMVKSALKGDLLVNKLSTKCSGDDSVSVIRERFIKEGGDFWVATTNTLPSSTDAIRRIHVVGCLGIKRRGIKHRCCDDDIPNLTEFEIFRLAVDDSYRGLGIGRKLIDVAETSLLAGSSRNNGAIMLYAVTPTCLAAACKLYESYGYCADDMKSFSAGELRMKVYSKLLCK